MADLQTPSNMIITFLLLATISHSNSEYIPPGPAYNCPKGTDAALLHPCVCENGTDAGLYIRCGGTGLAALSVGIGNIAGLGFPIESLLLTECKISRLFGSLFHRSTIRVIRVIDTPIRDIDAYTFAGVNRTLQELYMTNTEIEEFPKEAFKILSNLTKLSIDGHRMTKLGKDIFAGSQAVGRLERLHLVNGNLSDVPVEAFQNLRKLKTLDLHGNNLSVLKRNQFKGLRDVEVLDLSHNKIAKLDGSHLGDLVKMGWCNVSHNLIADIPRAMFGRNNLLKVLHLDNNKLKKLDTNSFKGMRFLRRLFLQDNQISDIGRGTFSSVSRIGTIDLARNKLAKVDYQMFQTSKFAEVINLAENNITKIETQAFTDLYAAVVNISHNQLTTIEPAAFRNCLNLTVLDFSHNNLTDINKKAFDENTYPFEFNVAYNGLTDFSQLPIQNMSGLRIINASYNNIRVIPKNSFPKLYELHTVDVSHNELEDIFNAVFQSLFSLRYLHLSHNSLSTIKPSTFGTLPTLLSIDISHNRLSSVSRGSLAKLQSCREINLQHNYIDSVFQIPAALASLNLAHNNLSEIKPNSWPMMNSLLRLNLSSNQLSDRLSDGSFSSLLTLQSLDLSGNEITRPPWEALSGLSSLQYLYMQNNNLTILNKSSFGNLPTLFQLDLSHNSITEVSKQSFTGLQQLLDLSLRGNGLEIIPNEVFKGLVALRRLDLSHNLLEKIDNKTNGLLDDCLSLEMVNLSYNNIGFLTKKMFPSSPWIPYRLQEVDLSHNSIPVLTYDITYGSKTLKKLNLSGNILNDIRNNVLGNLTSLQILDLSNNNLRELISKSNEAKLYLPDNITEMYLQNNVITDLPTESIVNATKLNVLDLRNNEITRFDPKIVKKVINNNLQVFFEGNKLKCDCEARPLKHYLNRLTPSSIKLGTKYNILCNEPGSLANENILNVDEDRLICAGNISRGDGGFDFIREPDLAFRDVQYAQTSIYAHWFVLTVEDVADFILYIKDEKNEIIYTNKVAYNLRSLTIAIDKELQTSFKNGGSFDICIQARASSDAPRKWHPSQCQKVTGDFDSWPKKLTVDKRRLTKKVKYSWFSNSVIGLVSDSILITLCIFLGVCLKMTELSDLAR